MDKKAKTERKRLREQQIGAEMIKLYCHGKHHTAGDELCSECQALTEYSNARSAHCPFMENKTFCSNCRVHCYKPDMRERIREVMRYSGPRMIFHHPLMTIWHIITFNQEKRRLKRLEQQKLKAMNTGKEPNACKVSNAGEASKTGK